jgi:gamma-glutamyltranspeptidase
MPVGNSACHWLQADKKTEAFTIHWLEFVHGSLYRYYSRTRRNGEREFYEGLTGKRLVEDIQQAGGIITMQVSIFS